MSLCRACCMRCSTNARCSAARCAAPTSTLSRRCRASMTRSSSRRARVTPAAIRRASATASPSWRKAGGRQAAHEKSSRSPGTRVRPQHRAVQASLDARPISRAERRPPICAATAMWRHRWRAPRMSSKRLTRTPSLPISASNRRIARPTFRTEKSCSGRRRNCPDRAPSSWRRPWASPKATLAST